MRFAHEFMDAETTVYRCYCQRHPITEFRLNPTMDEQHPAETFGDRVKRLREQKNMTQAKLADDVGCAASTISGIELGTQKSLTLIDKLADALGVTTAYLRDGKDAVVIRESVLTERETRLIQDYRELTRDGRLRLDTFLQALPRQRQRSGKNIERQSGVADQVAVTRRRRSG